MDTTTAPGLHGRTASGARPPSAVVLPALAILNAAVWGPTIANGFVFDDLVNVAGNPWIKDWRLIPEAFTHHAAGFDAAFSTSFYRPLMHVFYAVAYSLAGPAPWAFHLVNVALHVAAVLCAYSLTDAGLRRWARGDVPRFLPLVAALVFSVHPVHTEAVAWVAGITDLSYTVFGLAALIVYVRALARTSLAWPSAVLLLAAMLSKETGAVVVLLMALAEAIDARAGRSWSVRAAAVRLAPQLVATALYLAMRFAALGSFAPSSAQHPHSLLELAATGASLFARYLAALAVPVRLNAMHAIPLASGPGAPAVLLGLLAAAALVAVAVRWRRRPLVLAPMAVAVLPLLPVLYIPAIESGGSLFGERYLYLPVLGVGWYLGAAFEELRRRNPQGGRAGALVLAGVLICCSAAVVARDRVWASSLALWTDTVAKSPNLAAAHEGLCFGLYTEGRFAEALAECDRALALDASRTDARANRATTLLALGNAAEALRELDRVLAVRPDWPEVLVNRGLACMVMGRPEEALSSYRRALQLAPAFAEAHNDLGVALVRLGRAAEGVAHLEAAARLAPDNAEYRANRDAARAMRPPHVP